MMRAGTVVEVMALVLWIVQPISAQAVPAADPGLGPPLDSRLLELTRGRLIRIDYGGLPPGVAGCRRSVDVAAVGRTDQEHPVRRLERDKGAATRVRSDRGVDVDRDRCGRDRHRDDCGLPEPRRRHNNRSAIMWGSVPHNDVELGRHRNALFSGRGRQQLDPGSSSQRRPAEILSISTRTAGGLRTLRGSG